MTHYLSGPPSWPTLHLPNRKQSPTADMPVSLVKTTRLLHLLTTKFRGVSEPEVVATVRAAPAEAPAQAAGVRPLMVNVSRGSMGGSTTLVTGSQGSGFISINRLPEASAQSTSQGISIRRCIF